VHKTPFTRTSAQRHYTNIQAKFGGNDGTSYWDNSHWMWGVPGRSQIQVIRMDEVVRDVWEMGAVIAGKCMANLWVPL
jgi:hypothetical protein